MYGSIGMNLRILRLRSNLKQREVAAGTGISLHPISSYERNVNYPRRNNLEKLAEFYRVKVEEITEENS